MSNIKRRISFTKGLPEELDLRVHRQNDLISTIDEFNEISDIPEYSDKYISASLLKKILLNITIKFITEQITLDENNQGTLSHTPVDNCIFTGVVNINNGDTTYDLAECSANGQVLTVHGNLHGEYHNKVATVSYAYIPGFSELTP